MCYLEGAFNLIALDSLLGGLIIVISEYRNAMTGTSNQPSHLTANGDHRLRVSAQMPPAKTPREL